jgi:hypothetical protein
MTKTCPVCNNLIKIEGPQSYGSIEPGPLKERALSGKCPTCPLLFEAVEAIQSNAIDLANRLGVNASDGTLFLKVKFESGGKEVFELYSVKGACFQIFLYSLYFWICSMLVASSYIFML